MKMAIGVAVLIVATFAVGVDCGLLIGRADLMFVDQHWTVGRYIADRVNRQ